MTKARFIAPSGFDSIRGLSFSDSQLRAISLSPEQIATVIGSPGSGKTATLKARFLWLIEQGLSAEQILVICATRDSANSLRDELALELQGATRGPIAKTLTSYAFGILANRARQEKQPSPVLISGSEQDRMLKELLAKETISWPKQLDKTVLGLIGFRTELRDLLAVAIEYDLSPKELAELGQEHSLPAWVSAAEIYKSYLEQLSAAARPSFDSATLLQQAAKEISSWQKFPDGVTPPKAILLDDAQELTPAATSLLIELGRFEAGVVLFGDPDVATLGFRVANPKAMTLLAEEIAKRRGQSAKTIYLTPLSESRDPAIGRVLAKVSSQIEVARAGIQRKGVLTGQASDPSEAFQIKVFKSRPDEMAWLANTIRKRHLYEGVPWSEIAVVARSRPELEDLALKLSAESVPVRIVGSASALRSQPASAELLELANYCLTGQPKSAHWVSELLTTSLGGFDQISLARLKRALRKLTDDQEATSEQLLVEAFENPASLELIKKPEAKRAKRFFDLIHSVIAKTSDPQYSAEMLLWDLADGSGVIRSWREQSRGVSEIALQAGKNLDSLLALFAAASRYSERETNPSAMEFVFDQLQRDIPEDSLALNDSFGNKVILTTASGLIGKRFDSVAIPSLLEGVWPNLKPRSSLLGAQALDQLLAGVIESPKEVVRTELSGELRMLNKAVGATSNRLYISSFDAEDEQVSQFVNLINGSIPAAEDYVSPRLTLRSMVGQLRRSLVSNPSLESALALALLARAKVPGADPGSWYGLAPISTEEPLSQSGEQVVVRPSQLENYLKCPLHWFLESHGGSDSNFSASLGTLIHEVLEQAKDSKIESLRELTDSRWHTLEFEANWLEELNRRKADRMLTNLAAYLSEFEKSGAEVLAKEANFKFEIGDIAVRGQVDRIEKHPDGAVMIVDLKTTSNAPSDQDTKQNPQLALYQMALKQQGFDFSAEQLAGAKLVIVGTEKLTERLQPAMNQEIFEQFGEVLKVAAQGMAKPVFVAQLSNHCQSEREYGSCSLQLTKAVSYVG